MVHSRTDQFVLNLIGLHNHRHIRYALPLHLRQIPFFFTTETRKALHLTAAASLRNVQLQKRLEKEAAARKKAEDARHAAVTGVTPDIIPDVSDTVDDTDTLDPSAAAERRENMLDLSHEQAEAPSECVADNEPSPPLYHGSSTTDTNLPHSDERTSTDLRYR